MISQEQLFAWCEAHKAEQLALLKELAAIPSPSHHEEKRAEFIKAWLEKAGAKNVTIDPALNVLLPFGDCSKPCVVYAAHIDVVFPDTTPLPVVEKPDGTLHAPGVGDDTANVVALMLMAKYIFENRLAPKEPVMFVFNSCEEGLGNLKGTRQLFSDRKDLIKEFISFDGLYDSLVNRAVGSERWRIKATTIGGHSYGSFGNPNAIAWLAKLIGVLDAQPVPTMEGRKTTYNFGTISGGTSVNTIAQNAEMLYEYRSDEFAHLAQMRGQLKKAVESLECDKAHFELEIVGERPCGVDVDPAAEEALLARCAASVQAVIGKMPGRRASSTDANIPFSLGVPAVTFGLYIGKGAHTREEWIEIDSIYTGLKIGMLTVMPHFE